MARTHGRIQAVIWSDGDFIAMRSTAQRMFMFLLSQPDLSHAGLLPMRVRRWATKAEDSTPKGVRDELDYLAARDFVVVDEDTEEVLIRTMVRNDGVYKQPKVMLRLREDAKQIESPLLRAAFRAELERLPLDELSTARTGRDADGPSTREAVGGVVDALLTDFETHAGYPSEGVSDTPHVRAGALHQPPTTVPHPPATMSTPSTSRALAVAPADATTDRLDVQRLCKHLADRIAEDGSKRPTVGKGWLDAARLMLDNDGRSEDEIHQAIDWCQSHHFWRSNVLSMPKLREKYDQLRKVAASEQQTRAPKRQQETDDLFSRAMARAEARERGQA